MEEVREPTRLLSPMEERKAQAVCSNYITHLILLLSPPPPPPSNSSSHPPLSTSSAQNYED